MSLRLSQQFILIISKQLLIPGLILQPLSLCQAPPFPILHPEFLLLPKLPDQELIITILLL